MRKDPHWRVFFSGKNHVRAQGRRRKREDFMGMTVAEVRALLQEADQHEFKALEVALAADTRKGVVAALDACRRRLEAQEVEQKRIDALYAFDRECGAGKTVVGLDEVGRGAVAGPLAVGAVVLPERPTVPLLNDSKRLTAAQREEAAAFIKGCAKSWAVFFVAPEEIDRDGMAICLRRAFKGALAKIEASGPSLGAVLVDGNPLGIDQREINVVKGDGTSAAIAAASIVAKVERDHVMTELSSSFPQYGFSSHKGYGCQSHIDAIGEYGLSPVHRESFCRSFLQPRLF